MFGCFLKTEAYFCLSYKKSRKQPFQERPGALWSHQQPRIQHFCSTIFSFHSSGNFMVHSCWNTSLWVFFFLDGKRKDKLEKIKAESWPLNSLPGNTTHHSCLHLIGQNSVTWPTPGCRRGWEIWYFFFFLIHLATCQVKN